jgi:hypothetical protein
MNIQNIDYGWSKPSTYLVFVPFLSVVVQKMQLAKILPFREEISFEHSNEEALKTKRFVDIHKWHLRGSSLQLMLSVVAVKAFAAPIFSLMAICSLYEFLYTSYIGHMTWVNSYTFRPNGKVATIVSSGLTSLNMF